MEAPSSHHWRAKPPRSRPSRGGLSLRPSQHQTLRNQRKTFTCLLLTAGSDCGLLVPTSPSRFGNRAQLPPTPPLWYNNRPFFWVLWASRGSLRALVSPVLPARFCDTVYPHFAYFVEEEPSVAHGIDRKGQGMTRLKPDHAPDEDASRLRIPLIRLIADDPSEKRAQIRAVFHASFSLYERLFEHLIEPRAWYEKSIPLRHPLIFYFGHTAAFFVNKLRVAGLIDTRLDSALESTFAVGVDEMSWDDLEEHGGEWPPIEAVRAYRNHVRELVDHQIQTLPLTLPISWESPWWIILMGIEHEYIHLETSSVLIRQTPLSRTRPLLDFPSHEGYGKAPINSLLPVLGGRVVLGKHDQSPLYGWDNEYGTHETVLADFAASRYLVSNEEYLPFVQSGGYEDSQWWTEEGAQWQAFAKASHPTFWVADGTHWTLRVIGEQRPMPWNWPVEVNCHEAQAFCAWKSQQIGQVLRLPTEDEWRRLRDLSGIPDADLWDETPANIGLSYAASPCPVDQFRHGNFYDVLGNVWQWTASPIYPFKDFTVHPAYDDFSVPTFDQQHNLLKGGSFISLGNETHTTARYAFRRHFFQHAGFRYVESTNPLPDAPVYESDSAVSQYAEFHYGADYFGVKNFPAAIAEIAIVAMRGRPFRRALDLGCAVGRTSFELARAGVHVTGIDFSARFIQVGTRLRTKGHYSYTLADEGELKSYRTAQLQDLGLIEAAERVEFFQGDACNLKPHFNGYDLVVAANLIDRLYHPRQFLEDIGERILPGGLLVLASPYTWLTEHTAREEWLGGYKRDGETWTTFDALRSLLRDRFRLLEGSPFDVPFVIRETARKFQHSLAQVTIWERL